MKHIRWNSEDTIAAIATAAGVGGIGIVRISGPEAVPVADAIFRPAAEVARPEAESARPVAAAYRPEAAGSLARAESHRMLYGWVFKEEEPVDEVLAVVMRAPRSYTREDVVEIHCHGGSLVLNTVLELVCAGGARLAEPGEFTMRAFFNGRLDLTQVEAVADIVRAQSRAGLRMSAGQLHGRLYQSIAEIKEALARGAALLAAGIDFPEEDTVFAHREEIAGRMEAARERLERLVATADQGRMLRDGLAVAIAGRPNVGKSSLLNALLREKRAIVTEVPGTTRDTLEEAVEVGGVLLRVTDTAGIRHTEDVVEREGVSRSRRALKEAELVLLVLDGSQALTDQDLELLEDAAPQSTLVIVNKQDLMSGNEPAWAGRLKGMTYVVLSALTDAGLHTLEQAIQRWALRDDRPAGEPAMITNLRQKHAAQRALEAVEATMEGLAQSMGDELLAVDVQRALDALGDIVGETTADDLLERIFAEFCIGK